MSVHEVVIYLLWLESVLSGDTTLAGFAPGGVKRALAPRGTLTPFVVFGTQSPGNDSLTMNAVRLLTNPLLLVKAVGPASDTVSVGNAASQIDVLLKRTSGSASGGVVPSCYRESPFHQDEEVDGVLWTNIGGLYRLSIQQTS